MSPLFKSGAFIQQCFAVHPLSLSFKMLSLPDKVGVLCTNCNMRHRFTVREISTTREPDRFTPEGADHSLSQCATTHPEDLRMSNVDVQQDVVQLRCMECKRGFHLDILLFETHQP